MEIYDRKWPATVSQILWLQVCGPFLRLLSLNEYWVDSLSLSVTVRKCLFIGFFSPAVGCLFYFQEEGSQLSLNNVAHSFTCSFM